MRSEAHWYAVDDGKKKLDRLDEIRDELSILGPADFDDMNVDADGEQRLRMLTDELGSRPDSAQWVPLLLAFVERLDGVDLGSPGPIVHALEALGESYRPYLADSLRRKATPLTVWMANRILNQDPQDAGHWLALLRQAEQSGSSSPETVHEAREFLAYQRSRRTRA